MGEKGLVFYGLVGMRGNFEGTRNLVIDGCSRGVGRKLRKEDVGWIVDLKIFWRVGPCSIGVIYCKVSV